MGRVSPITNPLSRRPAMRRTPRLTLETLECKALLSPGPVIPYGITLNSFGVLNIKGADWSDDKATVTIEGSQVHAVLKHHVDGPPEAPQGFDLTDQDKYFPLAQVKSIAFQGLDGNDSFTNNTWIKSTGSGGPGLDILTGGSGADLLSGGDGNDVLEGRRGNDSLRGGAGSDDYVFAPAGSGRGISLGSDTITEAADADKDHLDFTELAGGITLNLGLISPQPVKPGFLTLTLSNALGIEDVSATPGADHITGNARPNEILAYGGADVVWSGAGADRVYGMEGVDELHGGLDNDSLFGGDSNDRLYGDKGHDYLEGQDGDDRLEASSGKDRLSGDSGHDSLFGSLGNDTLGGGYGNDWLDGGSANDFVWGGLDHDTLLGGTGADEMTGDAGNDLLDGGADADKLAGNEGDDRLDGGSGKDTMDGGAGGFDILLASQGDESLSNGERVEISVPGGSPQNDDWSCGPNSAARLLRSYGVNVTYSQLKADAQNASIISKYGLGTPPPSLQEIMKKYKSDIHLQSGASFQTVLDRLGEGRPVVALLGWGETEIPVPYPWNPFNTDIAPETLHYVCLTGFDMSTSTIFYTDTNGAAKSMSFGAFQQKWNWPGDGVPYEFLEGIGAKKKTILW